LLIENLCDAHAALVNRGELFMRLERRDLALRDFVTLLELPANNADSSQYTNRTRALLSTLTQDAALVGE
jgi:hypothetical protein